MIKWKKQKLLDLLPQLEAIRQMSRDPNTKTGAMIIDEDYTVRSQGYNGIPRGVEETITRRSRHNNEKYYWFEHAERNALYNALRTHTDIRGCHMILSAGPGICCDCARGIIQSMQKSIILIDQYRLESTGPWMVHQERSFKMFAEAGVDVTYIEEIDDTNIGIPAFIGNFGPVQLTPT